MLINHLGVVGAMIQQTHHGISSPLNPNLEL